MSETTDKRNNDTIGIDVILSVLESGHSVELPATGYSMFPALRPGDRITVRPVKEGVIPEPGSVVVFNESGVLVTHRLIKIIEEDECKTMYITRGDSMKEYDKPWPREKLVGVVLVFKRNMMPNHLKLFLPRIWRYKFNRGLLWLLNKRKILQGAFSVNN
jgi:signal peptidase I